MRLGLPPTTHTEIQYLLLKLGADMGFDVHVASNDQGRRPAGRHLSAVLTAGAGRRHDIRNRYNEEVRWEILLLEPVSDWFLALCKDAPLTADKVEEALESWPCAVRSSAGRWLTAFMAARFIT